MSESPQPTPAGGGRYQRSPSGLVAALLITVLVVLAFTGFRGLFRDNPDLPARAVDYTAAVRAARAEGALLVLAPERLPLGWKATSATYTRGASPAWHLGIVTDDESYVGVEEARSSVEDLVEKYVDADAEQGEDVLVGGEKWESWTDAGGDFAVGRSVEMPGRERESVLVVGTAAEDEIRDLAASLTSPVSLGE